MLNTTTTDTRATDFEHDFEVVRDLSEKWREYNDSAAVCLRDVYGRYSDKKQRAYNRCFALMQKYNGWGFTIISHNSFMFTCGFELFDPVTDEVCFAYITPSHCRVSAIEHLLPFDDTVVNYHRATRH